MMYMRVYMNTSVAGAELNTHQSTRGGGTSVQGLQQRGRIIVGIKGMNRITGRCIW